MDLNYLGQDRNKWRQVVNTVINIPIPEHAGNFLSSFLSNLLKKDSDPWRWPAT
jgi:hypothetical protein